MSIDDVIAHAGLTRGAFYAHVASKGELHAVALDHAARAEEVLAACQSLAMADDA